VALRREPGGGSFSGKFGRYVKRALETEDLSLYRGSVRGTWKGVSFLGTLEDIAGLGRKRQPMCLCECEALATLRHIYLGSFSMDPKDI
jgi:hypothetical protein